jgi:hypothetical protein
MYALSVNIARLKSFYFHTRSKILMEKGWTRYPAFCTIRNRLSFGFGYETKILISHFNPGSKQKRWMNRQLPGLLCGYA